MENNVDEKIKYLIGKMNNLNGIEDVQEINKILQEGITIDKILEEISTKQYDEYIEHKGLESLSRYYIGTQNLHLTPSHRQTIS